VDEFTRYYTQLHAGRRLTWQTNLGTAEVQAVFEKGAKELSLHTYQMCIMMLFNTRDECTYADLKKLTGIPDAELERHVLSLAHPKVRLLRKEPNNKIVAEDHVFAFNDKYTSPLKRIKIPLLSSKVTGGGGALPSGAPMSPTSPRVEEVPEVVIDARRNRVEAAIVRVMKTRKTLDHHNLVAEVSKQVQPKFAVDPNFIKKRIENLVEREYLSRDKDDRSIYHYVS
jgi:cullin 3